MKGCKEQNNEFAREYYKKNREKINSIIENLDKFKFYIGSFETLGHITFWFPELKYEKIKIFCYYKQVFDTNNFKLSCLEVETKKGRIFATYETIYTTRKSTELNEKLEKAVQERISKCLVERQNKRLERINFAPKEKQKMRYICEKLLTVMSFGGLISTKKRRERNGTKPKGS